MIVLRISTRLPGDVPAIADNSDWLSDSISRNAVHQEHLRVLHTTPKVQITPPQRLIMSTPRCGTEARAYDWNWWWHGV